MRRSRGGRGSVTATDKVAEGRWRGLKLQPRGYGADEKGLLDGALERRRPRRAPISRLSRKALGSQAGLDCVDGEIRAPVGMAGRTHDHSRVVQP